VPRTIDLRADLDEFLAQTPHFSRDRAQHPRNPDGLVVDAAWREPVSSVNSCHQGILQGIPVGKLGHGFECNRQRCGKPPGVRPIIVCGQWPESECGRIMAVANGLLLTSISDITKRLVENKDVRSGSRRGSDHCLREIARLAHNRQWWRIVDRYFRASHASASARSCCSLRVPASAISEENTRPRFSRRQRINATAASGPPSRSPAK
jgi:hypothetical protein